jgi:phosphoglycerate transporter family protein
MSLFSSLFAAFRSQPPAHAVHDARTVAKEYRYWRTRIMYSTTIGYAFFYLVRNNMSMATKSLTDEFHFSNAQWGELLSASSVVYGLSKFLSGMLGDRANPRYLLGFALLSSAVVNMIFGFGRSLEFFALFWAINSVFQGVGVPPCTRLLTYWFSPSEIGRAWGVWNASHQIGGAVIAVAAGYLVSNCGWRSAFVVPGCVAVIGALWIMNRLRDSPESMGLPPVEVYRENAVHQPVRAPQPFRQIFRTHILGNPWVWIVSVANFFVYVVRIGVLSWAPKYLMESKGFTLVESGFALSAFEISGIFGALFAGWMSDTAMKGRRGPVSTVFLLCLIGLILSVRGIPNSNVLTMYALFGALGFFVYGPQMLIAVAAADFATKVASASAVGLTGLFGYLGATFCGLATGILVDHYGWDAALWFYALSALLGAILVAVTWNRTSPLLKAKG